MASIYYEGRNRGKIDTPATSALITITDTAVGDLCVIVLGMREPGTQVVWPEWLTEKAAAFADGNDPSASVAYGRRPDGVGNVTVQFSKATLAGWEAASYTGPAIDWTEPIGVRISQDGNTNAPNPKWIAYGSTYSPGKLNNWLANDPAGTGTISCHGRSAAFNRANAGPVSPGGNWSNDAGGSLAGSGSSGLRSYFGGLKGLGTVGVNDTVYGPNAGSNTANARTTTVSYAVQRIYKPTPNTPGGNPWVSDQEETSRRVLFTEQISDEWTTDYLWAFGDGTTSTAQNPIHSYAATGDYDVVLTASNEEGQTVFAAVTITVQPAQPHADWLYAQEIGGYRAALIDQSSDVTGWLWEVYDNPDGTGTPTTYTTASAVHDFGAEGSYLVRLTVSNAAGTDSLERTIYVGEPVTPPVRPDGLDFTLGIAYDGEFHDVLCDVLDLDWLFGTDDDVGVFSTPAASKMLMRFWDRQRVFDPENTNSPIFGKWNVGSVMRLQIGTQGAVQTFWQGYIADLSHDLSIATLQGDDVVSRLANFDVDLDGDQALVQQDAGQRLNALLDVAGWPSASRDIEPGGVQLQGVTISNQSVWQSMVDVQRMDLGRLMVTQDGRLLYRGRGSSWNDDTIWLEVGCQVGADAGIESLTLAGATRAMVNLLRAGREGGAASTYVRQDSIDKYGRFTAVQQGLLFTSDAELALWAEHVLDRHSDPTFQGRAIIIRMNEANVFRLAELEMGSLVHVYDDTHEGSPIDFSARLLGMRFIVNPYTCLVTLTTTTDHPLVPGQRTYSIDTDTELLTGDLLNAKVTGTGEPAVVELDKVK